MQPTKLDRTVAGGLIALAVVWVAGWLPHYLTWPWWIDLDTYDWIARGWGLGRVPYRDVAVFNSPGQIQVFWLLGTTLGWGRPSLVYAFDATLLALFALGLCLWSRRRLGRLLPGLLALVMLLAYYLDQDYRNVAQRDWQGPLLAAVGLLVLQSGRGRPAILIAATLAALACLIRPHVILFVPAYAISLWQFGEAAHFNPARRRVLLMFGGTFALVVLFATLPLMTAGALGGLAAMRETAYGSRYAQLGRFQPLIVFGWQLGFLPPDASLREPLGWLRQLDRLKLAVVLVASLALCFRTPRSDDTRRVWWAWLAAGACLLFYAPAHPMRHLYLTHPLRIVVAINFALMAHWVLQRVPRPGPRALVLALLIAIAALPGWPRYWSVDRSTDALSRFGRSAEPSVVPVGAEDHFAPRDTRSPYTWTDYRQTLSTIRSLGTSDTIVFNLLRNVPFPAINGPTGRPTLLDAEGGIAFLYLVNPAREAAFASNVWQAPSGSLVICDFDQPTFTPDLELPKLRAAVRQNYQRLARHGAFEIWRKP